MIQIAEQTGAHKYCTVRYSTAHIRCSKINQDPTVPHPDSLGLGQILHRVRETGTGEGIQCQHARGSPGRQTAGRQTADGTPGSA